MLVLLYPQVEIGKAAITFLLGLLTPVGALIKAVIMIVNTVMFFIGNASRLPWRRRSDAPYRPVVAYTFDCQVMRQGVGLPRCSLGPEREDRALPDEVHGRRVLVQIREDGSERFARVKLLRGRRGLGVHVHHELSV